MAERATPNIPRFFEPPTEEDIAKAWTLVAYLQASGQAKNESLSASLAKVVHAVERVRDAVGLTAACFKEQKT